MSEMSDPRIEQPGPPAADFSIGAVLSRSFSVLFRNFAPFLLLAIVFTFPSQFRLFFPELATPENINWIDVAEWIVSMLGMSLLTATIVYGTILQLRGGHASMLDCVVRGAGLMLPVIAVTLIVGLLVGIGAILLVIPGLILYTILWVAVPAAVVERPGILASLSRSAELTKGYRWRVFGLIIVLFVISMAIIFGVSTIVVGPSVAVMAVAADGTTGIGALAAVIMLLTQSVVSALSSVAVAVGYHDLRIAKEGIDSDRIAAVFD